MSGVLASEKRTARQVQPPSAKNGAGSLTLSAEIRRHRWLAVRARARSRCRRVRRALLVSCAAAQAALHARLALGAHQSLRLRIRTAGRHLFLLAARLRSLSEGGLPGKERERRADHHEPRRTSHDKLLLREGE